MVKLFMPHCSRCKLNKNNDDFALNKTRMNGLSSTCKSCINNNKTYRANRIAYHYTEVGQQIYLKAHLKRHFNMTIEDKQKMLDSQNNCCEICNRLFKNIKSACVDHDHNTGKIRGLLCKPCNTFLGIIKEDTTKLITYIEKYKPKPK